MSDEAEAPHITFTVKSSNDQKYVITVPETLSVLELKEKLSTTEYADVPAERQRLIYSGRVLKDADQLSVYKIKDGNTVHMVKGAASNARQNPASSSSAVPGAGVPTNLATGTGNDPMAQLTGARYAGFAQMPGADMFGPDGGMGPPPNQEDMLAMMDNPMFASQMNEAMNNPAVIQMMQNNPMIRNNPMMRQMLENPEMRRMLMDPAIIRQSLQMQRAMGGRGGGSAANAMPLPGVTDTTPQGAAGTTPSGTAPNTTTTPQQNDPFGGMFGQGGAGGNPFGSLFGNTGAQGGDASSGTTDSQSTSQQQNPFAQLFGGGAQGGAAGQSPFNPEAMRQMMEMMGGGGGGAGGFNPFGMGGQPAAPAVQDTRPPEEQYSEQLRQLNEMGFYEFDRNVRALRMAGGNVQGAIELLFSGTAGL